MPPDVLRPVYDQSEGRATVSSASRYRPIWRWTPRAPSREAERLWKDVKRKNLMVKVPATPEGLPAIEHLIGEGISINITLLFSQKVYRAGRRGLSRRASKNMSPAAAIPPMSPASPAFFVSRIDSAVDKQLDEKDRKSQRPHREGAAGRAEGQGRHRQRQARLSGLQAACSPGRVGRSSRPRAPSRSGCCGPPPAPRTRTIATCSMSRS